MDNKHFGINTLACWIIYTFSATTNVIALGAFSESFLKEFQLTQQQLVQNYFYATLCVAFSCWVASYVFKRFQLWKILMWTHFLLGLFFALLPSKILPLSVIILGIQWLGQNVLIVACRSHLMHITEKRYQGMMAAIQESLGVLFLTSLPFILLHAIQRFDWQPVVRGIACIYFLLACYCFTQTSQVARVDVKTATKLPWELLKEKRFWVIHAFINFPLILFSGFYFNIEAFCKVKGIGYDCLEAYALPQALFIIVFNLMIGRILMKKANRWSWLVAGLFFSQMIWIVSLTFIQSWGGVFYVIGGALVWACLVLLLNVTWGNLYAEQHITFLMNFTVAFGVVCNALGPLVVHHVLQNPALNLLVMETLYFVLFVSFLKAVRAKQNHG